MLLDTNNPAYLRSFKGWKKLPLRFFFFLEKLFYHRRKFFSMSLLKAWRHFRERTQKCDLKDPLAPVAIEGSSEEEQGDELFRYSWQVQYMAAANYTPEPSDLTMVLLRSEVFQTGLSRDPHLGWGKVALAGLHMFEMPGEHDHMFLEPDVQRLAESLQRCLRRARAEHSGPPPKIDYPRLHEAV